MSAPVHPADARLAGVLDQARDLQPRTVALRRRIHRHPEQGLRLPTTQAAVLGELADLPLSTHTGESTTSVVGVLEGAKPGRTVLLRADMDALPLTEDTGLEFASATPGTMHACGHDTHVAMLASAARLLSARREDLAGKVVFMFQPGEEGHHGAKFMLDEGLLDIAGARPDRALAIHITSTLASGMFQSRPGPIMASSDILNVTVTGRGGHASAPHDALDPVPAAAAMVGALQTMITRRISVFDRPWSPSRTSRRAPPATSSPRWHTCRAPSGHSRRAPACWCTRRPAGCASTWPPRTAAPPRSR